MTKNLKTTLIITGLIVALVFAVSIVTQSLKHSEPSLENLAEAGLVVLSRPRQISDVNLLDHNGQHFNQQNFVGYWSVIFFGFTHCPDICPTTMATLRQSVELLNDSERLRLKVYLASADPERDRPAVLKKYVHAFAQDFIGLTGMRDDLAHLATQVGVTFAKVPLQTSKQHQGHDMSAMTSGDHNAGYTIDHSTQLVVLNPKGHFHAYLKAPHDPQRIALFVQTLQKHFKF